jgi:DNA-binding transcriptional regulator YdaS (Cro superfamily)
MYSPEIKEQHRKALGVVWRCFGFNKTRMAEACGVNRQTVYQWFRRGKISATAAIKLENHDKVKGVITKEQMRPDVNEWFGV